MAIGLSRRDFIKTVTSTSLATLAIPGGIKAWAAPTPAANPIVVFTKVYQELKLDYAQAAALTAEAGLQGVDCPVRPGGEVLPERVTDDLPRYVEELRKSGLSMPLITSAITGTDSPHAETVLRTAKKLGVRWYRLGFVYRDTNMPLEKQIGAVRARLKDIAALNKQVGISALFQNHSPAGKELYLGGDLNEMRRIVEGFDPEQIGVAFDIGHAIAVHGDGWRDQFKALQPHFKIAYVKDVTTDRKWVPFGQGAIGKCGYFDLLKQLHYSAPFSLHIEYDWTKSPDSKSRASLLSALKESSEKLRKWAS